MVVRKETIHAAWDGRAWFVTEIGGPLPRFWRIGRFVGRLLTAWIVYRVWKTRNRTFTVVKQTAWAPLGEWVDEIIIHPYGS